MQFALHGFWDRKIRERQDAVAHRDCALRQRPLRTEKAGTGSASRHGVYSQLEATSTSVLWRLSDLGGVPSSKQRQAGASSISATARGRIAGTGRVTARVGRTRV